MQELIDQGGVDLDTQDLIWKQSLLELQESLALVLNWT
jgi:hypothetical protein